MAIFCKLGSPCEWEATKVQTGKKKTKNKPKTQEVALDETGSLWHLHAFGGFSF
jgi:hypothetical protein